MDRPHLLGRLAANPHLSQRERAVVTAAFEDLVAALQTDAARAQAETDYAAGSTDPAENPRQLARELAVDLHREPTFREGKNGSIYWCTPHRPPPGDPEPGAGMPPRRTTSAPTRIRKRPT